jgi:hypothetical protein
LPPGGGGNAPDPPHHSSIQRTLLGHRPARLARLRRLLLLAGGIGVLAGCDGQELTSPTPRNIPAKRDLLGPLGSTFLAPPANSSPDAVASITAQGVANIPDSTWVVMYVDGGITQTGNPDCNNAPPYWPCQTGSVVGSFGATPWEEGPVKIWSQQGSGGGWTRLRGVGGGNASHAVGLHFQGAAGVMSAQINMQPKWAWNPNTGTGPYSYDLGGGYNVTVLPIASPIIIVDSGPIDEAGTHSYYVRPANDLQFINPTDWYWSWPAGAVNWYFFPGESVSETPGFTGPYYEITQCHFQLTCSYLPPGLGRVQATGYVETRYAAARTQDEPGGCGGGLGGGLGFDLISSCGSDAPHLGVSCHSNPLTAGNTTTCTAAVDPATPFTVRTWHFASDAPGVTADDTGDHKSWTFAPSVSGTVTVTAMVAGSLQMATVHVQVMCNLVQGPTNDATVNDPDVQQGFRRLWAATQASGQERGAFIILHNGHYSLMDYLGPFGQCSSKAGNLNPIESEIVGLVHTHPFAGGNPLPNTPECNRDNLPNPIAGDGPSTDKDVATASWVQEYLHHPVNNYVLDGQHVHRYHGPLPDIAYDRNLQCP